jgi:hypothetical protein
MLSLLVPLYFSVGPFALSPSKVLFLFTVPFLTVNLLRGSYGGFMWADGFIFAFIFWMAMAMFANHPPRVAVEFMGSNSLIILGGYLTARATIRTPEAFVGLIQFMLIVAILSLPFAIYESTTSRTTIPRWLDQLPGVFSHGDVQHPRRLGLFRTQFVFAHPIHYGLFCLVPFSLVYIGLAGIWSRFRRSIAAFLLTICCVLSVSSGPLIALMAQIGLIIWFLAMRWTGVPWRIFAFIAVSSYIVIELLTERFGVYSIVERLALNRHTAFSRKILFEVGVEQIWRTPILGIGYSRLGGLPSWLSGSMDNYWLLLAVRFGIPTFLFFFAAFLIALIGVGRRDLSAVPNIRTLRLGWIFVMSSLGIALATVAIWGEIYSMIFLVLGSGLWIQTVNIDARPAVAPNDTEGRGPHQLPFARSQTSPNATEANADADGT